MDQTVAFAGYRFELETGRLWSGKREIRLTPKASAVLRVLMMHAGNPVPKEELFASVWNDTVVSDDALTSCVQELRKALADDSKRPRFIETRHRRGYRFVARLSEAPAEAATHSSSAHEVSAIAVLPFADMSPRRDQGYLCEGFAEELINALTRVDGLRVASRTASFRFRGTGEDVRAVGRHLGVGSLLEGSLRKADDRLRVTVQLVEVTTGYHRWSRRFDRRLGDVFALQDEIARSVAASLGRSRRPRREKARGRSPSSAFAYEHYLRGRHHLHRMTQPGLERSRELFERALEGDAEYGPAWAGLAVAHATLYEWFGGKDEDLARAERANQRAMEVAPGRVETLVAGGVTLSLSRRYDEAEREFEEAIAANRSLFDAYYYFARTSFAHGEVGRSAELFRKAAEARPEDFQSPVLLAQSLRMLGEVREAREADREGVRRAEHMLALNPVDGRALALGSQALFRDGHRVRAMEWSRRSLELYPDDAAVLFLRAGLHAKSGQKEGAMELLGRLFASGRGKRDWVERDPDYDIVRDEPRFKTLVARLK